nr:hypothetical protein [Cytobacillus firmus]
MLKVSKGFIKLLSSIGVVIGMGLTFYCFFNLLK